VNGADVLGASVVVVVDVVVVVVVVVGSEQEELHCNVIGLKTAVSGHL